MHAGSAAVNGWTLKWAFPSGQTINQIWSASATQSSGNVTVKNLELQRPDSSRRQPVVRLHRQRKSTEFADGELHQPVMTGR